jgi:hypothetical protein
MYIKLLLIIIIDVIFSTNNLYEKIIKRKDIIK